MERMIGPMLVLLGLLWSPAVGQDSTAVGTYDGRGVDYWIGQLSAEDENDRRRAAYALGQIGPPAKPAVPKLVAMLEDTHAEVRWYAVDSLGRIGPAAADAVDAMVAAMQHKSNRAYFRHTAARALGRIGPGAKGGERLLLAVLQSEYVIYKVNAAVALWRISQHKAALPALEAVLKTGSNPGAFEATMALLEFGPEAKTTVSALVAALNKNTDSDVRRAAVAVLGNLGADVVPAICRAIKEDPQIDQRAAADALGLILAELRSTVFYNPATSKEKFREIAAPLHGQVLPVMEVLLSDAQPEVRKSAARALARLGPSTVKALLSGLRSTNSHKREAAFEGLERLEKYLPQDATDSPAVEEIKRLTLPALIEALEDDDPEVLAATLRIFAALNIRTYDEKAARLLRQFVRNEDAYIRRDAKRCLDQMKDE